MRIARFMLGDSIKFGRVHGVPGDEEVTVVMGDPLGGDVRDGGGESHRISDVRLLSPVVPTKIVAVGRNYHDHAAELALDVPDRPRIFLKPPSSLIAHGEAIRYPDQSDEVHHEAELAVIIGRICHAVTAATAGDFVAGYTCANDVTARDIQRLEGSPVYAKSFDTFCPIGPWMETDFDSSFGRITCAVNGTRRQDGKLQDMIWDVPSLIAYVSAAMTLMPGDVLLTGTPAGVGPIRRGDEVSVAIDGIGTLRNAVEG